MKVSSELQAQLNAAAKSGEVVAAVLYLKGKPAPGEPTKAAVKALLDRVKDSGRPSVVNVFDNLSSFVVVGTSSFVQMLALQPEIERAVPNSS